MVKRPVPYYWIYFIRVKSGNIKIGRTTNIRQRFTSLLSQGYRPEILVCIATIDYKLEGLLHEKFLVNWVKQEYYEPSNSLLDYISMLKSKAKVNEHAVIDGYYDVNLIIKEADIKFFNEYDTRHKMGDYNSIKGVPLIFRKDKKITQKIGYDTRKYQEAERRWQSIVNTRALEYIDAGYNQHDVNNLLKADKAEYIKKIMEQP